MKAVGTGIVHNLQTLSFSCKTPSLKYGEIVTDTKLYKDDVYQKNWKFEESLLDDNHCTAVAVEINEVIFKTLIFILLFAGKLREHFALDKFKL